MTLHELTRTVIIPLAAAAIGAVGVGVASYYASKNILIDQERIEQAVVAYADYLSKVSELAVLEQQSSNSKSKIDRLLQEIAAAKSRIAMFGRPEVIVALNDFRKAGSTLYTSDGCEAFTVVVTAMRKHVSDNAPDDDLLKSLKGAVYGKEDC